MKIKKQIEQIEGVELVEKADKGVLVAGRCVFMNEDPSARQFAADLGSV